jgi:zinc-ribbon domain
MNVRCPRCGEPQEPEATACPHCGKTWPPGSTSEALAQLVELGLVVDSGLREDGEVVWITADLVLH